MLQKSPESRSQKIRVPLQRDLELTLAILILRSGISAPSDNVSGRRLRGGAQDAICVRSATRAGAGLSLKRSHLKIQNTDSSSESGPLTAQELLSGAFYPE